MCNTNDTSYIRIWIKDLPDKNLSAIKLFQGICLKAKVKCTPLFCSNAKERLNKNIKACYGWFQNNEDIPKLLKAKPTIKNVPVTVCKDVKFKRKKTYDQTT